jgi:hypothetical protein
MFDPMKVALFRSEKDPDVFAFTTDETGANPPRDFAPWEFKKSGNGKRIASPVALALIRDGICLACTRSAYNRLGRDWHVIH